MRPTLLYTCFECFEPSFPQSLGGNPELFYFFKDTGFPITTSGMTSGMTKIDFFQNFNFGGR